MLRNTEVLLLTSLFKHGGSLSLYTIHRRFGFSPARILNAVESLSSKSLINSDGLRISLSSNGFSLLTDQKGRFRYSDTPTWKIPPEEYQQERLSIDDPYIPVISKLDPTYFESILNTYWQVGSG